MEFNTGLDTSMNLHYVRIDDGGEVQVMCYPPRIGRLTQKETAEAVARAMNQSPELTGAGERRICHESRYSNVSYHCGVYDRLKKQTVIGTVMQPDGIRTAVAMHLNHEIGWHVSGRRKGDRYAG